MTAREYKEELYRRQGRIIPLLRLISNDIRIVALRRSKELMTAEIYSVPEDLNRRGQARQARHTARRARTPFVARRNEKKWTRTGNLRHLEQAEVRGPVEVRVFNTAAYAIPRHEAGKPGHRKINPRRESHWQEEMAAEIRPLALAAWREAIKDALGGRR